MEANEIPGKIIKDTDSWPVIGGYDEDNKIVRSLRCSARGHLILSSLEVEIAKGNVPGHSIVNKFGLNETVPLTGEILDPLGNTALPMPPIGNLVSLISSSVEDKPTGTGIGSIFIEGLDSDWNLQDESVILNGDTGIVQSVRTYLRIFRMQGDSLGSGASRGDRNAGAITASIGGLDVALMLAGFGRTTMATYPVPVNHKFHLKRVHTSVLKAGGGATTISLDLHFYSIGIDGVKKLRIEIGAQNSGSTYIDHELKDTPEVFEEKTDVFLEPHPSTTAEISGGFSGILIQDGF